MQVLALADTLAWMVRTLGNLNMHRPDLCPSLCTPSLLMPCIMHASGAVPFPSYSVAEAKLLQLVQLRGHVWGATHHCTIEVYGP